MPARPNPLRFERLEDRTTPALFGNPWPDSDNLTLSFVPDGTDVGDADSSLHGVLNKSLAGSWQKEIVRAFQSWGQHANLNFQVVSDDGSPFGQPGPVQGSAWFGDIRVSARPLSDNVLAVATPFDLFNSWAGEVVLNSNKSFNKGGGNGSYDLYTVVVQEAGHALGLDNSTNANSVMHTTYTTPKAALAASDVAAIQALYGPRSADRFDLTGSNDTPALADPIAFVTDGEQIAGTDGTLGSVPLVAAGDLTTLSDVDTYSFKNPKGSSDFYVAARTDQVGQLQAKVSVLGPDNKPVAFKNERTGQTLTSATVVSSREQPFLIKVENALSDKTYKVVVEGATEDLFGVGPYKIAAGHEPHEALQPTLPSGYVNRDGGTNDLPGKATDLGDALANTSARWDFRVSGSVHNPGKTDVDFYKIHTKSVTPKNAVFLISAADATALIPSISVTNKDGVAYPVEAIADTGGTVTLQLKNVQPNTDYFVRVAAKSATSKSQGNYVLAVDFRDAAVALTPLASTTLQGANNQAFTSFALTRSQSLWFGLSGQAGVNAAVRMTVYDAANKAVFTVKAKGGESTGGDVLLAPGRYTVRYVAAGANGAALPTFRFTSRYTRGTDPIGTQPANPNGVPPTPQLPPIYNYNPEGETYDQVINEIDPFDPNQSGYDSTLTWIPPAYDFNFHQHIFNDIYSNPWW